jgi:hypothetical protein
VSEQPTKDELLNVPIEELIFDSEDAQLQIRAHSYLIRIDGTGWLNRQEATVLRDWLNTVLS